VATAAHRLPFIENCLTKAFVTQLLFKNAGYAAKLHIGVAKGSVKSLDAHAWVESDGKIVVGRWDPAKVYAPLGGFNEAVL